MTSREPAKASSGKLDFSIDSLVGTSDCNKVTKSTVTAVNGSQMTKDSSQSKESETKPNRNGSAFTQPSSSVIWNPNAGAGVMDYASPFNTQLGLLKNNFLSQAAAANSILLSSQSANPVNFCYSELSKQQQQQSQNGSLWQSNPYFLEVLQKSGVFPSTPYSRFCHGQELTHPGVYHPYRKPKRIRTAFSPTQLLVLERSFDRNHYVVGTERKDLAKSLGLSETQVKVWFQNRRTKFKRQKNEDDSKKSHASTECGSTKPAARKHHDKESSTTVTSSGSTDGPIFAKGSNLVDDDRRSSLNVEDDDDVDDDEMIDDENDNESLTDVSN